MSKNNLEFEEFRKKFLHRAISEKISKLAATEPFVDQAKTHTFSDWLLAYAYDFGYGPKDKFKLGSLPDLHPAVSRTPTEAQINLEDLIVRPQLPLGALFEERMKGSHFIDLGCGDPKISVVPRLLAEKFEAQSYWGIDLHHTENSIEKNSTEIIYIKMDLLEFLARLELDGPKIFFFGGIDPKDENYFEYLRAVRIQLIRLCKKGDILILGAGSTGLGFDEESGRFQLIYNDYFHEISEAR